MSVRFEKISPSTKLSQLVEKYKSKIEGGILPPDPARMIEFMMRGPPTVEHLLPIPPILETIHEEIVTKIVESLPRLPMTSDHPIIEWLKWIKEEM